MALIKKKDVKNYFAARRARHPLHAKSAKLRDAANPSRVEQGGTNASSSGVTDVPKRP
jgi:hypothetical protein